MPLISKACLALCLAALSCATAAQPEEAAHPAPAMAPPGAPTASPPSAEPAPLPAPSPSGAPAPDPDPAPGASAAAPSAVSPAPAPPSPSESPARATLRRYYSDINHHDFEATRYFAPAIKRYITMKAPTSKAIDRYIRNDFPKQFESYEFLLDEPTLREDGPNALIYAERCLYYLVKNREFHTVIAEVRVEFDQDGKITDFHHLRVIARDVLPEKH